MQLKFPLQSTDFLEMKNLRSSIFRSQMAALYFSASVWNLSDVHWETGREISARAANAITNKSCQELVRLWLL